MGQAITTAKGFQEAVSKHTANASQQV